MAAVRKNDRILFYIIGKKEIRGVYKAVGKPFYDDTPVWLAREDQVYPFRLRIDNWDYVSNLRCP
jgi:hypothetical protein